MLELFVAEDPASDRMPITSDLIGELREVIADGVGGGYDIDSVLFYLALSVMRLENQLLVERTHVINLETRILQAGLRLADPDE